MKNLYRNFLVLFATFLLLGATSIVSCSDESESETTASTEQTSGKTSNGEQKSEKILRILVRRRAASCVWHNRVFVKSISAKRS